MKILKFLLLCGLATNFIYAQDIDIKWGDLQESTRKSANPEFLGIIDEDIYLLKGKDIEKLSDYYVEVFDYKTLKSKRLVNFSETITLQSAEHSLENIYLDKSQKRIILISSYDINSVVSVYATVLKINGDIVYDSKKLAEYDNKSMKNKGSFSIFSKDDLSSFMLYTDMPSERKGNEKINIKIFDTEFNLKTSNDIVLPYSDKLFSQRNLQYDNDFNIYLIGTKYSEKRDKIGTNVVFFYNNSTQEFSEINIPMPGKNVTDYNFSLNEDGLMEFSGFFKNSDLEGAAAIFYIKFNPKTGETKKLSKYTFNSETISKAVQPLFTRDIKLSESYVIKQIFSPHKDTMVFVAEYAKDIAYYNNGSTSIRNERGHILVFKTDLEGKIASISIVPKNQFLQLMENTMIFYVPVSYAKRNARLRQMLSYIPLYKDNKLYFLYNDNIDNLKLKNIASPKRAKFTSETAFLMAEIEPNGTVTRKVILPASEDSFLITPLNSAVLSDDEILVLSISKSQGAHRLGIMSFK